MGRFSVWGSQDRRTAVVYLSRVSVFGLQNSEQVAFTKCRFVAALCNNTIIGVEGRGAGFSRARREKHRERTKTTHLRDSALVKRWSTRKFELKSDKARCTGNVECLWRR